jgi:hypothetical protein
VPQAPAPNTAVRIPRERSGSELGGKGAIFALALFLSARSLSVYSVNPTRLLLFIALCTACQVNAKTGKHAAEIVGRGVVNSPTNKSLRFDMLKFGLRQFCEELLHNGTPLRLSDGQPVMGRFFGETCEANSVENLEQSAIFVQFSGRGYAWTAGTGRMGFRSQGLLQLAPDFRIYKDAMYVYFRPVQVDTSAFSLLMTERPLAEAAVSIMGLNAEELGKAIVSAQLGRGFTAIRYDADGNTDFALGLVDEGRSPFRYFDVITSPRLTAANGRTEFSAGQMDFLGKIHVEHAQEIVVSLHLEGTERIDFALLKASSATPFLDDYLTNPGVRPLPVVPTFQSVVQDASMTRAAVSVPEGDYYLVLDHSKAVGSSQPSPRALPARVDYLVQTGNVGEP